MVDLHRPSTSGTIATPARQRPRYTRPQRCLWPGCRAVLPHDHPSPICSCHVKGYRLEHDKGATELVLHLLLAAYPDAVDLAAVLHADPQRVVDRVRLLRRRGHAIKGLGRGYVLESPAASAHEIARQTRTVKVKAGGAHA